MSFTGAIPDDTFPPYGSGPGNIPNLLQTNFQLFTCPPLPNIRLPENYTGGDVFIQTFFEGPATCQCCKNWVEKEPNEIPPEVKKKYAGAAIVLYKSKDHTSSTLGGLKRYNVQTVDIQSPVIQSIIAPILAEMNVYYQPHHFAVQAPFKELFFGHSQILDLYEGLEEESEAKVHLKLLIEVMDSLFKDLSYKMKTFQDSGVIESTCLWAIFPRRMIVYSCIDGLDRALEVLSMDSWTLRCRHVEYDGSNFGYAQVTIVLEFFTGTRHVRELKAYPFSFHSDADELREKLFKRGQKALRFQDMSLCTNVENVSVSRQVEYDSDDSDDSDEGQSRHKSHKVHVGGRVVVDSFQARRSGFHSIYMTRLEVAKNPKAKDKANPMSTEMIPEFIYGRRPSIREQKETYEIMRSNRLWLMLMDARLPCYHLKEKLWAWLSIDSLEPTTWNDCAFDQLVLSPGSKELISSFVETHKSTIQLSADVVQGKGRGLVILLSGPTGTGKTLTVESTDKTRRPLYHLQAGELGSNPLSIRKKLRHAFELCEEWDGILLLDEADALIRSRKQDSTCEDLCCVLLATLEYYSGIMFLTTNLSEDMDNAIGSRLDIHLEYPSLSFDTRLQLWENFLLHPQNASDMDERPNVSVTSEQFRDLASWEVNGRDIKHAVKNATKWCFIRRSPITREELEVGLRVTAPRCKREETGFALSGTSLKRKRTNQ
ncbi:hypothetical protein O1611_g3473 [Lasiodiplodia mahajangana]|uniref:Uncharacterized protein n=1 Tax=Lasiodiplodia mahajangana TaxID=1108764 RepID=A0ACC2JS31_9PEZI|nr:hypothetical protein O1611_g3473 [Lasiodiplodia mahajangana]